MKGGHHDPHRNRPSGPLQTDPLVGKDRRHIFKIVSFRRLIGRKAVDTLHIEQSTELLSLGADTDISDDDIAGLESEAPDLARRHIYIVFSGHIVGTADKSKSVLHDFQNAVCHLAAVQFCIELILVKDRSIRTPGLVIPGKPGPGTLLLSVLQCRLHT